MATSKPFQSHKVGQTLQELESAFADWEALTDTPLESPEKATSETRKDSELRKKTKMLLDQLREQIAQLDK